MTPDREYPMRYRFHTADVFTDRIFGGNPLAVFPDARGLATQQMQQVAREFNLSETVFVLPPKDPAHTRRLRIFTPGGELPFAGHPTVGCAHVLAAIGEIPLKGARTEIVFEEGVGPVPVRIDAVDGVPASACLTAARAPERLDGAPSAETLAGVLSLDLADLCGDEMSPEIHSCGVPYVFVPVRDRAALARIHLDRSRWQACVQGAPASDLYAFCATPENTRTNLRARMFAPGLGIAEDPATGSAAAALAGYLGSREAVTEGAFAWTIEQGFEMGRPSMLHLEAEKRNGIVTTVRVAGSSVLVSEGTMEVS